MKLNYKKYGSGPPLIILHGLFGSLANWQTQAKELASGYTVYLPDQRNHGSSFHSPTHTYEALTGDIFDFMDEQKLGPIDLIGHSMGGKTAMSVALARPDSVRRLVVVDIAPRAYRTAHDEILAALCELDPPALKTREEAEVALASSIPEERVRKFLLTNLRRDPDGGFRWRMNLSSLKDNYREITKGIHTRNSFRKPTLFIRGEKSSYVDRKDLSLIKRLFPLAEVRTIAGAGHWVHVDAMKEFLDAVRKFLSDD